MMDSGMVAIKRTVGCHGLSSTRAVQASARTRVEDNPRHPDRFPLHGEVRVEKDGVDVLDLVRKGVSV
jgi:hypothetical protein